MELLNNEVNFITVLAEQSQSKCKEANTNEEKNNTRFSCIETVSFTEIKQLACNSILAHVA